MSPHSGILETAQFIFMVVGLAAAIYIGSLLVPIAALFWPWLRACRASLFLPAAALVPTAFGALIFKVVDRLQLGLISRPSETIETYLYFFILAYLIVFARRIKQLEVAEGVLRK